MLEKWPSFPGEKRLKTSLGQEMYYVCLGRDRIKLDRVPISVTMVVEFLEFLSQGYNIGFVKDKFVGTGTPLIGRFLGPRKNSLNRNPSY